jgi:hypothetical protein
VKKLTPSPNLRSRFAATESFDRVSSDPAISWIAARHSAFLLLLSGLVVKNGERSSHALACSHGDLVGFANQS